ncbi:DNA glycosylase AlkZ-like family protein [Microtetraspora niveoalba]|uniref:DNA glycosylase AlkZ-like family protein n=1 Tax=Microtetraspora niveoalba TaxID=46175 RepID=UPI002480A590|nr:crosslink repair DNA glycosylase YcaQ family protein [Microtetraspora niveoalba]
MEAYLDAALLDTAPLPTGDDEALVLPGFDEYLLGYKDRSLMIADEHKAAIIPGNNGVFQSTVVRAGRVVAVWKRILAKSRVRIAVQPLVPLHRSDRAEVERAFEQYAKFVERIPEVRWP